MAAAIFGLFLIIFFVKMNPMQAVVEIAGKQFNVVPEQLLYTPKLSQAVGEDVAFENVLLLTDEKGNVITGRPFVATASIKGKILAHVKDSKIVVFKKKRRKGYKKTQGHRQAYTQVRITEIRHA